MRADLHIHTYYSDGLQSPDDVAAIAKANGVQLVSVTDHDTALACAELSVSCEKRGIKAVNGIEVSAYFKGRRVHVLGYGIDPQNARFVSFTDELCSGSLARADDIISKLKKCGVGITLNDVLKYRKSAKAPVHGMHIARAGASKGYSPSPFAFHKNYLSSDAPAHSELCRPSPEQAVEIITACGGFASLAHPGRLEFEKQEVIAIVKRLVSCGLKGIEAVYSTHTQLQTDYFKEMAKEYGLRVTGGSDTHFKEGSKRIGLPVFDCSDELCEEFLIK